jgi:hypothetical protein
MPPMPTCSVAPSGISAAMASAIAWSRSSGATGGTSTSAWSLSV